MTEPPLPGLPPPPGEVRSGQQFIITRDSLRDNSLLDRVRAEAPAGVRFLNDAEIEASLDATFAVVPPEEDVWIFGYGSLMWNPALRFVERRVARIHGYHRSYCLWLTIGRGSVEHPGLMLGLDRGGSCNGVAYRIAAEERRAELLLLWRREMSGTAYRARWVTAMTSEGPVRAMTFVVDRNYPRYAGRLTEAEIAAKVATGAGMIGTCAAYLSQTLAALQGLGLHDPGLERIARSVAAVEAVAPPE